MIPMVHEVYLRRVAQWVLVVLCMVVFPFSEAASLKDIASELDEQLSEQAKTHLEELLENPEYQKQAKAWYYRGAAYDQLMRKHMTEEIASTYLEEAIRSYRKATELSKKESPYHSFSQINLRDLHTFYLNRGVQYNASGAFDEALEQVAICHQIMPPTKQTWLYMALLAHQADRFEEALSCYEQCLQAGYVHPAIYQAITYLAFRTHNLEKAMDFLQQGLQKYPWHIDILAIYCQLLAETKQLNFWEEALKKQLEVLPGNPIIHHKLAALYIQSNNEEQAITDYQRAYELAPNQVEPAWQLARLYYNQGAVLLNQLAAMKAEDFQQEDAEKVKEAHAYLEKSLPYFMKAYQQNPKNLSILQSLRNVYSRLLMKGKASQIARKMKRLPGGKELLAFEAMK